MGERKLSEGRDGVVVMVMMGGDEQSMMRRQ